jgi:hypothetical protein
MHALGNRNLNGLAALDAGNDETGATVVDNEPVATVRTVEDYVRVADFSALIIDVGNHFRRILRVFDCIVFVHVLVLLLDARFHVPDGRRTSFRLPGSRLLNSAGTDALGAYGTAQYGAAFLDADRLEVRHETALRDASGVEAYAALVLFKTVPDNGIAGHRFLAANFTNLGHDENSLITSRTMISFFNPC